MTAPLTGSGSAACMRHGANLVRVERDPERPGYARYECPEPGCPTVWEIWRSGFVSLDVDHDAPDTEVTGS